MAKNKSNMKKFITGAVTATMVASAIAPVAAAETKNFEDIKDYAQETQDIINGLVAKGIITGTSDTTFSPGVHVKRGQVVKMLGRYLVEAGIAEAPADWNSKERFKDVPVDFSDQDLVKNAAIVFEAGVFTGDNGALKSGDTISRQNMAVVLDRAAKALTGESFVEHAAGKDSNVSDIDTAKASAQDPIKALNALGISSVEIFKPLNNVTRAQFATFLSNAIDVIEGATEEVAPEVVSVSAINAKQAEVTFKGKLPEGIDFSNFEIDGGLVVTEAKVTGNKAVITVNQDFVRNQEYTVTATGIKDADDKVYADTTGKFTWVVQEGVTVALEATTVDQGEKFGLTVKDAAGKEVKDATVEVTSFNTNLLVATTATGAPNRIQFEAQELAGEVEVEVETTLIDGSVLTNTFKVTVKEPIVNIADKGFAFLPSVIGVPVADGADYEYANTAAFQKYADPTTTLVEGTTAQYFYAFTETNGNPDDAHIDWTKADRVQSSNAVTATAVLDKTAGTILVTPNKVGKTTLTVTFDDKTKRTFNIEVTAKPVFKDLYVSQTDVKLSDEAKNTGDIEGVNQQTVKLYGLDQFKKLLNPSEGKVVISTDTKEGLKLTPTAAATAGADNTVTLDAAELAALTASTDVFTIGAEEDKAVKNAKVTINYFAKDTDAKATLTKTINVNVTDVDADVKASGLDLILTHTTIDANGENNPATEIDLDFADADQKAYLLDSKGNRIGTTSVASASYQTVADENVGVAPANTVIEFTDADAQTYLRASNTVTVQVTANDIGADSTEEIKQNAAVKYENTAVLPDKATVKTNAVSIKLADAVDTISLEQILFGIADEDQLKLDDAVSIAVLKNAKNAGYKYNQPLVTVTGTDGKALPLGVSLYGSTAVELATASLWNNAFTNTQLLANPFVSNGFDFEYEVTNIVTSDATATVDAATSGDVVVPAEESATFTLVVKAIYIAGDDVSTDAAKAKNNLLASPVQLNVSVEGADL